MLDYEVLFYRLLSYVVNENGGCLDSALDVLGITPKEAQEIKKEFNWDDEELDTEAFVADWARNDYDNGKPVEDYTEFSGLCEDEGIEPTPELYKIYVDNCCYHEDEEEEEE